MRPGPCANIVLNPRRPVARHLGRAELERLGAVHDRHRTEHPWPVAGLRLLTLTGARLSEVLGLRWDKIGEEGASVRLEDSKTGPRTVWLGPEAARVVPEDPTSARLYSFWVGIREEAGLAGLCIHDARHTCATKSFNLLLILSFIVLHLIPSSHSHRIRSNF